MLYAQNTRIDEESLHIGPKAYKTPTKWLIIERKIQWYAYMIIAIVILIKALPTWVISFKYMLY